MATKTTEARLIRIESRLVQIMHFLGMDPDRRYLKPPATTQQPTKETKNVD